MDESSTFYRIETDLSIRTHAKSVAVILFWMVIFSDQIRDLLIAPKVSDFTTADIPDMTGFSKDSAHWVENFFLNSLVVRFEAPMHAYAFSFLRRAQYAFSEHHLARCATQNFLDQGGQSIARYVEALFHWECFLSQAYLAYLAIKQALKPKIFETGDGSIEQRLNSLYNATKHFDSRDLKSRFPSNGTMTIWLDNRGLTSLDAHLSFEETAEVLKDLARYANAFMNPATAQAEVWAIIRSSPALEPDR